MTYRLLIIARSQFSLQVLGQLTHSEHEDRLVLEKLVEAGAAERSDDAALLRQRYPNSVIVAQVVPAGIMIAEYPHQLTVPLSQALTQRDSFIVKTAQSYRANGHPIAPRIVQERAYMTHRFVRFALLHGATWQEEFMLEYREVFRQSKKGRK